MVEGKKGTSLSKPFHRSWPAVAKSRVSDQNDPAGSDPELELKIGMGYEVKSQITLP